MMDRVIGVVGAGTMGAGIAQIAAAAGHRVRLYDQRSGAAAEARDRIGTALAKRVAEGKLQSSQRDDALARLTPTTSLSELADCNLVIEAIVESIEPKRTLFAELEATVADDCILASNTSSLSITALARDLKHPRRFLGLHFFNPVPAMKLVEVVVGLATDPTIAAQLSILMRTWGKTPVTARSTPGFIVNRIARPFYAEALWLLQERRATPQQIDQALRAAGFRMGPCELMDLIGHDVNLAVTESVYTATYGDKRFVPSPVQRDLVDAGHLGRKTGRGFYEYSTASTAPKRELTEPVATAAPTDTRSAGDQPGPPTCLLTGSGRIADAIAQSFSATQLPLKRQSAGPVSLNLTSEGTPPIALTPTDGRTAGQLSSERVIHHAVFDWPLTDRLPDSLAIAFPRGCPQPSQDMAVSLLRHLGIQPIVVADTPGLIVARTVSMLINEAADAVQQEVCNENAADTAMRLGVNYPAGPFEWLTKCGVPDVVTLLEHLQRLTCSERYRASPWLLERHWQAAS
jgi:3-hydroxybutyryl-CoA dehydrogenase